MESLLQLQIELLPKYKARAKIMKKKMYLGKGF
jgi:hypothetical protein